MASLLMEELTSVTTRTEHVSLSCMSLCLHVAVWGVAAVYGMTAPVVEWIETDVGKDHTYVSSKCDYSGITCNYWSGHYSVFCV
jgi:hypothetical protein